MAREYAQVRLAIWADDDFRSVPPNEQHLYFVLLTSPTLNHCGVADWRPARISALAGGWTPDAVIAAAAGLMDKLYVLVDQSTEEVLVRSFIRHDGVMKQPKMAAAMSNAHAAVSSSALRGVVVHELNRLRVDEPDLRGWTGKGVGELLGKGSVDPSTYPLGKGSVLGSRKGSVKGSGSGNSTPPVKGSVNGSPIPAPTPTPSNQHLFDSLRESASPSDINPGMIVAAWVEAFMAPEGRQRPSESMRKQAGKQAKDLIDGGANPPLVLEAARLAAAKGYATIEREYAPLLAPARNGRPSNLKDWVEQ